MQQLASTDWTAVHGILRELEERGRQLLVETGAAAGAVRIEAAADMRYIGQGYEVTVPIEHAVLLNKDAASLRRAFERVYEQRFGRLLPGMQVEVVSWRLRASAAPMAAEVQLEQTAKSSVPMQAGERPVYFAELGAFHSTPVYSRSRVAPGQRIEGPAIIEEAESTVVVGPRARIAVEENGNLVMHLDKR